MNTTMFRTVGFRTLRRPAVQTVCTLVRGRSGSIIPAGIFGRVSL